MKTILKLVFLGAFFFIFSCSKDKSEETGAQNGVAAVRLNFANMAGSDALLFGSVYQTSLGEDISLHTFKYYISNISFKEAGTTNEIIAPETYHLVDHSDPTTYSFILNLPAVQLSQIRFLLGVDSTKNVSGAQSGDLDPAKEMFWTWNSGYIMAKLEGSSSFSSEVENAVTYHIGGFRTGENVTRQIVLDFPAGEHLALVDHKTADVFIRADALKWFSGVNALRIEEHPTCTTPGSLATSIAGNYANMFSISGVNNP